MLEVAATRSRRRGCSLETSVREEYRAYRFRRGDPAVRLARRRSRRRHTRARDEEVGGGADAHVFNGRGIPCVKLTNGMERIHTTGRAHSRRGRRSAVRCHARARRPRREPPQGKREIDEGRRRHGDQARRVPRRADAGRCARARRCAATRCWSSAAPGSAAGSPTPTTTRPALGSLSCDDVWARGRAAAQGEGAAAPPSTRSSAPGQTLFTYLHLAPAPELTRALIGVGRDLHRLRDGRDRRPPAAAARADERGRRPARAADGRA